MESLALVVATLLALVIFSGPIAIALTSNLIWDFTERKQSLWIFRRVLVTVAAVVGLFLSLTFALQPIPAVVKLLALFGLLSNGYAISREYFRSKDLGKVLRSTLGITRGSGRSSGKDSHGPAGQS